MESDEVSRVLKVVQESWPNLFDGASARWECADNTVRISNDVSYATVARNPVEPRRLTMVFGATLIGKEHGYGLLPYPVKSPLWPR
jgi:hypothetical protein